MPALPVLLALASLAADSPGQVQARPGVVAQSDGGWRITEIIAEDRPSLAVATEGLLVDEAEFVEARSAERQRRERESDEAFRRSFEEAVDAARRAPQP